ncbi:MAG: MBL fold metallo-hydrolase [Planctomycetota bacterium]|nr:MBL fold metallo-hydrolase [Planctomycetota bacterium]
MLLPGSARDPLVVVRSGFWNFNGIGLFDGDEALVVDPGIFPEDIALLGTAVATRGNPDRPRTIEHVILTHSHHDHIRGWQHFPGARVTTPQPVADKNATSRERIVAAKTAIDETLGTPDPDFVYPSAETVPRLHTFEQQTSLRVGELEVELHLLLGHSNCCSVVWIPAHQTLLTGDYLVSPGIPYCRWQAKEFEEALVWLRQFTTDRDVQRVIPANNAILKSNAEIKSALELEIDYFAHLRATCQDLHATGLSKDKAIRQAADTIIPFRESRGKTTTRAARRQDRDNAGRILKEIAGDPV